LEIRTAVSRPKNHALELSLACKYEAAWLSTTPLRRDVSRDVGSLDTMSERWVPLSARIGARDDYGTLHEGVPPWLRASLSQRVRKARGSRDNELPPQRAVREHQPKGFSRVLGQAENTILLAFTIAASNLELVRTFLVSWRRTGDASACRRPRRPRRSGTWRDVLQASNSSRPRCLRRSRPEPPNISLAVPIWVAHVPLHPWAGDRHGGPLAPESQENQGDRRKAPIRRPRDKETRLSGTKRPDFREQARVPGVGFEPTCPRRDSSF
jgi:hypothetical protein